MSTCSDDNVGCEASSVDPAAIARARSAMPSGRELEDCSGIFAAMGDPTRLRILEALGTAQLCVCDLAVITGVSQSGVSHQLRTLRHLNLVTFKREGKRAVYRLSDDHVRELMTTALEHAREGEVTDGR